MNRTNIRRELSAKCRDTHFLYANGGEIYLTFGNGEISLNLFFDPKANVRGMIGGPNDAQTPSLFNTQCVCVCARWRQK